MPASRVARLLALCLVIFGLINRPAAAAPSFGDGWYWDLNNQGMGVSVETHNGTTMFLAIYTYIQPDPSIASTPIWYAGLLTVDSTGGLWSGTLYQYAGGQTLTGSYRAPTSSAATYTSVNLRITGTNTAALNITSGFSMSLIRFPFGGLASAASGMPAAGWWWNSGQSGRGWYAEVQGSLIYFAGFMYSTDGSATWYYSTGTIISGAAPTYSGSLFACTGGPTFTSSGGFNPSLQCLPSAGSISLVFGSSSSATLTLPSGAQVALTRFSF